MAKRVIKLLAIFCLSSELRSEPAEIFRFGGLLAVSVIGEQSFSKGGILALDRDLSKSRPYPKATVIDSFPYHFAHNLIYSWRPIDSGYEQWADSYRYGMDHLKNAKSKRLVRVGANVVLQSYDSGHFEEDVTSGTNPTLMQIDGVNFRLLGLVTKPAVRLPASAAMRPPICTAYIQASRLPVISVAVKLSNDLRGTLGVPTLYVTIRADAWFIVYPDSPVWFPFTPQSRPPDALHYTVGPEMFCKVGKRPTDCQRHG